MSLEKIEMIRSLIYTRAQLLGGGITEHELGRSVRDGSLLRVSRGLYCLSAHARELKPEDRHLISVVAAAKTQRIRSPFASHSAAALLGLPLYRFRAARPQILVAHSASASNTNVVQRRVGQCSESELTAVGGVLCTNIDRTVVDMARFDTPERALACADAAIRIKFPVRRGEKMSHNAKSWKQHLTTQLAEVPGKRGVRRAADVLRLADGSADSPLESVGRWRFETAGYEVAAQVRVPSPDGGYCYVDLELLGLGILCEIDGKIKYTDPNMLGDLAPGEAVFQEKKRSEWIEGATGKRLIRLGSAELDAQRTFTQWLREFRVPPPRW